MTWLSDPLLWSALAQIIAIDLLLGGDNAVVIAMACRRLPRELQTKAIYGGMFGAIVLRVRSEERRVGEECRSRRAPLP